MKSMIRFVLINIKSNSIDFKEYTTELMRKVETDLVAKEVEFYTNKDRMRKCSLVLKEKQYFIQFTNIMTHGTSQLKVDISREAETKDDVELHDLKFKIKDLIIDEWEQCVWLEDRQSEELAEDLYKDVHLVENSLRRLINTVLFYKLGGDWWEKYMPTQLTKKYNQRNDPYRDRAPSFKNIHTNLLSIDTGDLATIISFKTYRLKDISIFKGNDPFLFDIVNSDKAEQQKELHRFQYIMNNLMNDEKSIEGLQKTLTKILQEQMEVEKDFWKDYFEPWFNCKLREFQGKWENFSTDRNHVAHNKLIDNKLYQKFKKSMGDLLTLITEAEQKFSEHLDQEMNNYLEQLEEMEEIEYLQREDDFRELKAEQAGVEIRDEAEILKMLREHIHFAFSGIEQEIYYRSDLKINYFEPSLENNEDNVFMISHNIIDSEVTIDIEPFINAEEAGISKVNFIVYYNNELQETFQISYTNGEAEFSQEQGCYLPNTQEELDIAALEELETLVLTLVEDNLPEITEEDIASFSCEACQQMAVSISIENENPVGICLLCGHSNQVGECMRCEEPIDSKEDGFCDSCDEFLESQ